MRLKQSRRRTTRARQRHVALFLLELKRGILLGISRYVRQSGPWKLFIQPTEQRGFVPDCLSDWEGDGIIGRISDAATAELVLTTGVPFVDILGAVRRPEIPLVRIDDAAVGRVAAEHLLERGFTYFGYYGPSGGFVDQSAGARQIWSEQRRDAFARTVEGTAGKCEVLERPWAVSGPRGWQAAEEELSEWLRALPKPAGVMAANDQFGQRVLAAARRAGVKVPEELAVVGVDDEQAFCEVCDPPLSSISLDSEQQGYKAAELLDGLMDGEPPPAEPLLIQPGAVHVRQSTDILAIDDPLIAEAVRFIRENACHGIGVADVLREVPLSRSVLQRSFRRIFGQGPNDMIVERRLKRAQQLLLETDLPIATVAEMAGFSHQCYLTSVFRKKLDMTPFAYRRRAGPGRHLS